jgi:hypothetical protein
MSAGSASTPSCWAAASHSLPAPAATHLVASDVIVEDVIRLTYVPAARVSLPLR